MLQKPINMSAQQTTDHNHIAGQVRMARDRAQQRPMLVWEVYVGRGRIGCQGGLRWNVSVSTKVGISRRAVIEKLSED